MGSVPGEVAPAPMNLDEALETILACITSLRRSVAALAERVETLERDRAETR